MPTDVSSTNFVEGRPVEGRPVEVRSVENRPVEMRPEAVRYSGEANSSGVAWGAVIGGAFVASALYLILLTLGAGFGLSAVSPWTNLGASASAVGIAAIIWLIVIEIIASGFGGYLTGRLRTKWTLIHNDEVFFRDTANGFLSWAVALVVSVTFMVSAAAMMAGRVAQRQAADGAAVAAEAATPNAYYVDTLFRSDRGGVTNSNDASANADVTARSDASVRAEAGRIFATALGPNGISTADRNYLARMVAARTGMSQTDAETRVSNAVANAQQTADTARRDTARFLLWMFIALLVGAFSASYFATIGGRQRDHVRAV